MRLMEYVSFRYKSLIHSFVVDVNTIGKALSLKALYFNWANTMKRKHKQETSKQFLKWLYYFPFPPAVYENFSSSESLSPSYSLLHFSHFKCGFSFLTSFCVTMVITFKDEFDKIVF